MNPPVGLESDGVLPLQHGGHVCFLVQQVPTGRESIWGLVWIIRIASIVYEWVLIWVPVPDTGSAAPGSLCRWRAWWCSASWATFAAFLLYTAHANCSSLHCMPTFFGACGCDSLHAGRDSQYSFSLPKLIIKCLGVGLVSWCGSHPT